MAEEESKKLNRVAIVGSAASTRDETPWYDEDVEIWVLAWNWAKRADRAFDLHGNLYRKNTPQNYPQNLDATGVPIYLQEATPEIEKSVTYPLKEVINFLASFDPNADGTYFSSSIAYMFALAMYEGFQHIEIYGVDLIVGGEYNYQRPNTEYLIGLARGMGITVYIPENAALVSSNYLYGYEAETDAPPLTDKLLQEQYNKYKEMHDRALARAHTSDGAMQAIKQLLDQKEHYRRGANPEAQLGLTEETG